MKENKCNEFEETYKNALLTFNLFFIFFYFSFPSTFTLDFLSITFSLKISEKGVKLWLPNLNHARFMI